MRQIHPIGFQERFVSSGMYIHVTAGKPNGLVKSWSIHELSGGARLLRVDWDGRNHQRNGRNMLVEALYSPQANRHRIERLSIRAYGCVNDPIKRVDADHIFFDDHVEINRKIDDRPLSSEQVDLPPDYIVFPGTRLFLGLAIAQAITQGSKKITVLTNNAHRVDETAYQCFTYDDLIINFVMQDLITIASKVLKADCYTYQWIPSANKELKTERKIWLDEHDILLREFCSDESKWVELTQYAWRPEPSTS